MSQHRFVSVGECMIEMSGGEDRRYRLGYAGDTLNTAWYARARLPENWQVDYFTALGDDRYSDEMAAFFAENGIGTGHIRRIGNRRPGLYLIHQAEGDRHFTYWRDRSAARLLADDRDALAAALAGARMVYFSGITLAILTAERRDTLLAAVAAARRAGSRAAFDPNVRPALWPDRDEMRAAMTAAAKVSDVVLPTFEDEALAFGDDSPEATAGRYLGLGASEVVVKNGAEDALVALGDDRVSVPPVGAAQVVDATGAGDSFGGTYLSARLEGATPRAAAEAAHRVAATVIGHRGALVAHDLLEPSPF